MNKAEQNIKIHKTLKTSCHFRFSHVGHPRKKVARSVGAGNGHSIQSQFMSHHDWWKLDKICHIEFDGKPYFSAFSPLDCCWLGRLRHLSREGAMRNPSTNAVMFVTAQRIKVTV